MTSLTILPIAASDVLKTARLDPANAVDTADVAFVIAIEQAATEARLRTEALTDSALIPLLTRNVIKLLAAEVLEMRSREEGASATFQGAGVTIGRSLDHPARLREEAINALTPYLRTGAESVFVGSASALSSWDGQNRLFGRTEAERGTGDDC